MAAGLRIWLLGGFRAELADRPVPEDAWHGGRATAVVKVLALAPDHCLHREQVMDALWPDLAPEAAGAHLRKAVHYARRATSPRSVLSHGEVLVADAWVDVDAFEAAADVGDVPAALELYTGELLPEDRFARWAEERRRRLQERCAQLLLARASELAADGEPGSAAELLERAIGLDPLDERAVGELMRCYAATGRRHLALARYGELQARLVADLGVSPGPHLQRLRAQLASGRVAPPGPVRRAATLPLDERKVVTLALVALWHSATLHGPSHPWTWRFWHAKIDIPPGRHQLVARAWNRSGACQPEHPSPMRNPHGYANNAWHRLLVTSLPRPSNRGTGLP